MKNDYRGLLNNIIAIEIWDYKERRIRDCLVHAGDFAAVAALSGTWYAQKVKGEQQKWYAQMKVWIDSGCRTIMMHRIILGLTDPLVEAHHRDNDGLNNQRTNLEECSHIDNMRFRQPDKDWDAYDRARYLAESYRLERSIADVMATQFGLTRQALWCIRTWKTKTSKAAIAYRDACDDAKCLPFWRMKEQNPVDGKKFGAVRIIPKSLI